MKITCELDLADFKAWSGGRDTLNRLIDEGVCEDLEFMLDDIFPDGMTDTQLNDFLWFDAEWIFETLGISDEDEDEE